MIPAELEGIVVGVFGLDNRPQAKPHFRVRPPSAASLALDAAAALRQLPVHPDPDRQALRLPSQSGRNRPVHRDHRAGGRLHDFGPRYLLLFAQPEPHSHRHERLGRPGEQHSDRKCRRARRRGDARHRSRRRGRARGQDRRLLHAQHVAGFPGRGHPGRPRHREQAVGHLDQLGRAGIDLDRPGDRAVRSGVPGRGGAGHHHLRRGRRQRFE